MGVGKTTTSKILLKRLPDCVFLDGDWCWYADPWTVTEETKAMSMRNMSCLLDSFLACSAYRNVVFCWVMHLDCIRENILAGLENRDFRLFRFSLICSEAALRERLQKDIDNGVREPDITERASARLEYYKKDNGDIKIDVSSISPQNAADIIYRHIYP